MACKLPAQRRRASSLRKQTMIGNKLGRDHFENKGGGNHGQSLHHTTTVTLFACKPYRSAITCIMCHRTVEDFGTKELLIKTNGYTDFTQIFGKIDLN